MISGGHPHDFGNLNIYIYNCITSRCQNFLILDVLFEGPGLRKTDKIFSRRMVQGHDERFLFRCGCGDAVEVFTADL